MVDHGLSQRKAAKLAGMHEVTLSRNLAKPHVRRYLDRYEAKRQEQYEEQKRRLKWKALEVAHEIMTDKKAAAQRMRAVEFLSGAGKAGGVQVNVQNNISTGYAYPRPGERVVEIRSEAGATDNASGAIDSQATEIEGESE